MAKLLLTLKGIKLSQKHADKRQYKTKVSMKTISCSHPLLPHTSSQIQSPQWNLTSQTLGGIL